MVPAAPESSGPTREPPRPGAPGRLGRHPLDVAGVFMIAPLPGVVGGPACDPGDLTARRIRVGGDDGPTALGERHRLRTARAPWAAPAAAVPA